MNRSQEHREPIKISVEREQKLIAQAQDKRDPDSEKAYNFLRRQYEPFFIKKLKDSGATPNDYRDMKQAVEEAFWIAILDFDPGKSDRLGDLVFSNARKAVDRHKSESHAVAVVPARKERIFNQLIRRHDTVTAAADAANEAGLSTELFWDIARINLGLPFSACGEDFENQQVGPLLSADTVNLHTFADISLTKTTARRSLIIQLFLSFPVDVQKVIGDADPYIGDKPYGDPVEGEPEGGEPSRKGYDLYQIAAMLQITPVRTRREYAAGIADIRAFWNEPEGGRYSLPPETPEDYALLGALIEDAAA